MSEIVLNRMRLNRMRLATNLGLYAAILLLSTLILSGLDVVFGSPGWRDSDDLAELREAAREAQQRAEHIA
jgi:hypothetical protein